jgi:hypothetical protein
MVRLAASLVLSSLAFRGLHSESDAIVGNLIAAALFAAVLFTDDLVLLGIPKWMADLLFWLCGAYLIFWYWSVQPEGAYDPE